MFQQILQKSIPVGRQLARAASLMVLSFSLCLNARPIHAEAKKENPKSPEIQRIDKLDGAIEQRLNDQFIVTNNFLFGISIGIILLFIVVVVPPMIRRLQLSKPDSKGKESARAALEALRKTVEEIKRDLSSQRPGNQSSLQTHKKSTHTIAEFDPKDISAIADQVSRIVISQLQEASQTSESKQLSTSEHRETELILACKDPNDENASINAITDQYHAAISDKTKQLMKQLVFAELNVSDESEDWLKAGTPGKTRFKEAQPPHGSYILCKVGSDTYLIFPSPRLLESYTRQQSVKGIFEYVKGDSNTAQVIRPAEAKMIGEKAWEVEVEGVVMVPTIVA